VKRIDLDAFDRVVVSVQSDGRRTRLHTFISPPAGQYPGYNRWALATPLSRKQAEKYDADLAELHSRAEQIPALMPLAEGARPQVRRKAGDLHYGETLGDKRVSLGYGVSAQGWTLGVIFEALRSAGRSEVDLRDIKTVLSQLGKSITRFNELPVEQWRHAEPALYAEIVRRCTTV